MFLVIAYYHGNMKASMTVPILKPRFSSLADLNRDEKTTLITSGTGSLRSILEVGHNDNILTFETPFLF